MYGIESESKFSHNYDDNNELEIEGNQSQNFFKANSKIIQIDDQGNKRGENYKTSIQNNVRLI